jgi:diguanylate cyclase (GGDEF)-like protein/PAS domain S-box-containing protein
VQRNARNEHVDQSSGARQGTGTNEAGPTFQVSTSNCDREPIHIPGAIQPHGALVAYDPTTGTVLHASNNLSRWLPVGPLPAKGRSLSDVLGEHGYARLQQALSGSASASASVLHQVVDLPARPAHGQGVDLEAILHIHRSVCIAEFEPALTGPQRDWLHLFGDTADALRTAVDLEDLVGRITRRVKRLTGMDRVMVYRFNEDWHGHVIADVHESGMESFIDLHYPTSDIPAQARELYRSNLVRYIADVDGEPVPVAPWLDSVRHQPLDMSHSMLRTASPIHLQYLRNMGVRATLTLSILVDGRLWGLVACHHRTPISLPIRLQRACFALAINVGFMVGWNEQRQQSAAAAMQHQAQRQIVDAFNRATSSLPEIVEHCTAALLRLAGTTGGAFWQGDTLLPFGQWPDGARGETILRYVRTLFETSTEDVICTDQARLDPPLEPAELRRVCGVLAVKLDAFSHAGLVWLRPELRREVAWGGDPDKPVQVEFDANGQPRLTPRASFARWEVLLQGRSRPWTAADLDAARTMLTLRQVLTVRESLAQISQSDRQFRSLVTLQSDAYWQTDVSGRLLTLSKPLPISLNAVEGCSLTELLAPHCEAAVIEMLQQALASRAPFRGLRLRGGAELDRGGFVLAFNGEPIRANDGLIAGWHGTITDVSHEASIQEALQLREDEQRAMLDNDLIGITKVQDGRMVWNNKAMNRIFGYATGELLGQSVRILYPDDDGFARAHEASAGALQAGQSHRIQVQLVGKDGRRVWIDMSGMLLSTRNHESMWMLADITPMHQSMEQAEHLAYHDTLTGLPNRLLLADRLSQAMASAKRQGSLLAVCYIDLDGFKAVNDEHSHSAGDVLLKEIARRLLQAVRLNDTVCRLGGDEFVLLMTQVAHKDQVQVGLQRLIDILGAPVSLDSGRQVQVSATIGVAIYPDDGDLPDVLIGNADWAMYQGKKSGRNQVCIYDSIRVDRSGPDHGPLP